MTLCHPLSSIFHPLAPRLRAPCRNEANSALLVDFTAVADVMEINAAKLRVELIKHPVIADAQFEFRTALQSLMWERLQSCAHFIHLPFHGGANR